MFYKELHIKEAKQRPETYTLPEKFFLQVTAIFSSNLTIMENLSIRAHVFMNLKAR